ncbi:hypothetical protein FPV67DRAFT_307434 [Lyophyllum atratum]|nr:hypothetical protein FPV67DRAFT_307434 [Lyophyllum atratum]
MLSSPPPLDANVLKASSVHPKPKIQCSEAEPRSANSYAVEADSEESSLFRLPAEMLSEIFFWSCLEPPNRCQISKLGLVCKAWRDITTSQSAIWIHVNLPFPENRKSFHNRNNLRNQRTESLQLFLSNFPYLRIRLTFRYDKGAPHEALLDRFSHRWSEISLMHSDGGTALALGTQPLPNLISLSCSSPYTKLTSLPHTPRLQRLHLTTFEPACLFDPQAVALPWKQITALSISSCPWSNLLDALAYCDNLQELTLSIYSAPTWAPKGVSKLTLELKAFNILVDGAQDSLRYAESLLACIRLPSVTTIMLGHYSILDLGTWSETMLIPFLSEAVSLTYLRIIAVPLGDGVLLKCLSAVPQLQSLNFTSPEGELCYDIDALVESGVALTRTTTPLLQALEVREPEAVARDVILPNLTSLILEDPFQEFDPQTLLIMIHSRSGSDTTAKGTGVAVIWARRRSTKFQVAITSGIHVG